MLYEIDFTNAAKAEGVLKRLIWLTDLHLDAIDSAQYRLFLDLISSHAPDAVFIGGDICNGTPALTYLSNLAEAIAKPLYFILGNHDFYYTSIANMRLQAKRLSEINPALQYLTVGGIIPLSESTALIGHDGWADAQAGDFMNSTITLNDYFLIDDLKRLNFEERKQKLQELGHAAALSLSASLTKALKTYDRVILLTHVPPFVEACLHDGVICDANWAPHFVNVSLGVVLKEIMQKVPQKHLLVLCGHTHYGHDTNILPNLRVVTGHSELGQPDIQGIISVN